MRIKFMLSSIKRRILIRSVVTILLSLGVSIQIGFAQTKVQADLDELYGGIELGVDGARAVAIRIFQNGEDYGLKLVYSELIPLSLSHTETGDSDPQATREAVTAVDKLSKRLKNEYYVPEERTYII